MKKPTIMRKRFIPFETVDITGDALLYRSKELLITSWKAIKQRLDFAGGISYTFLRDGIKVSRFYDSDGKFLYWYCDIIDVEYEESRDRYTIVDLLVDIKLLPDGSMKVLDAGELADALEQGLITPQQACSALHKLDRFLRDIYSGEFPYEICKEEKYWQVKNG